MNCGIMIIGLHNKLLIWIGDTLLSLHLFLINARARLLSLLGNERVRRGLLLSALSVSLAFVTVISLVANQAYVVLDSINYAADGVRATMEEAMAYRNDFRDAALSNSDAEVISRADAQLTEFLAENQTPIQPGEHGIVNILLLGCDCDNYSEMSRSDSMMILSIDEENRELKLTSLMRDMRVNIPGYGKDKLNAAYAYDTSVKLLLETIKENFRLSIDKFICVNYEAFTDVVDLLGGIDVEIQDKEIRAINLSIGTYEDKLSAPGMQTLNGAQALAYCRMRRVGNDTERTRRQRDALEAVFAQVKSCDLSDIIRITNLMAPSILTNLSVGEILSLVSSLPEYRGYEVLQFSIPVDGYWTDLVIDQIQYINFDAKKNVKELIKFIYGDEDIGIAE